MAGATPLRTVRLRAAYKAARRCIWCGRLAHATVLCRRCTRKRSVYAKKRRAVLATQGLCVQCGKRPCTTSVRRRRAPTRLCAVCLAVLRTHTRRWWAQLTPAARLRHDQHKAAYRRANRADLRLYDLSYHRARRLTASL